MNDAAVLVNVVFWTILFLGLNASGWLMIIPGASIVALPFIVYIIGKDKGWHQGVRSERYAWQKSIPYTRGHRPS